MGQAHQSAAAPAVNRRSRCCATRNADDIFFMSLTSRNGVVPPDTDIPDTMCSWSWTEKKYVCVSMEQRALGGKLVLINTGSRQGARRQVPRLCGHPVAVSCTEQAASFKFMLDKHAYGHSSFPVRGVTPQQRCETLLKQETSTKATHRSPKAVVFATQLKCSFIRKTRGLRQETTNVFAPLCISRTAWRTSKPQEQEVCCSWARWDDWCSAQLSGLQGRLQPYGDTDSFRGPAVPIGRSEPRAKAADSLAQPCVSWCPCGSLGWRA